MWGGGGVAAAAAAEVQVGEGCGRVDGVGFS